MSSGFDHLMFFNKEGYPYNFLYDPSGNTWSGKIFFDENSSDTFRTQCIYVFEDVKSYNFTNKFDLLESQLFNYSGMTFIGQTYENQSIDKIQRVNSSINFYSKWIFGTDFDKKFPVGSIIAFQNVTGTGIGWNDFYGTGQTYFNVYGARKNAILVETKTNNKDFDVIFNTGGTVSSYNIIRFPDYGTEYLTSFNNFNYYPGKKLTIFNSSKNDGVYTYRNYDIQKNRTFDFLLLTGLTSATGNTLSFDIELFTQKPELYEGIAKITYVDNSSTGTTIEFINGVNTNIDFTTTGQTMIFEDVDGNPIDLNNPTFTITGYMDKQTLTTDVCSFYTLNGLNYIETVSGFTGYTYNDNIKFYATPNISGVTFHSGRTFKIIDIQGTRLNVDAYIIPESGNTYQIDKILNKKKVNKLYATQGGNTITWSGYTVCFSDSNKINITQDVLNSGNTTYFYENTITALRNKYKTLWNHYGFDTYHWHNDKNNNNYLIFEGLDWNSNADQYFNCRASINGTQLNVGHSLDYYTGNTYTGLTDVYYMQVDEKLTYEKIQLNQESKLAHNFKKTILFNLQRDSLNYGINLNIDQNSYYVPMSGSSTIDTINSFIDRYFVMFDQQGVTLCSGTTTSGYTMTLEGQYPNVEIINLEVKVNSYSTYKLIEDIINHSIVISSNELYSPLLSGGNNLYDFELATGMIITVSGANHTLNNKQYNILRITDDIIQLSYQGPFFYEYGTNLNISVKEFLRKPRGNYDKQAYYKMSWEAPYDNSIFFYDYSGDQLVDNGNLTYIGPKPLFNSGYTNKVYLNPNPNTNPEEIDNPEYQQTIFEELLYPLEEYNSQNFFDYRPIPLEIFLGFNSPNEGVVTNSMKIEQVEFTTFTGTTSNVTNKKMNFVISGNTIDCITDNLLFNFNTLGFQEGQNISLDFYEITITGETLFEDYEICNIVDLTTTKITVDKTNLPYFDTSASGKTYNFVIKVEPTLIANIQFYGQTEVEDERFEQHLKLLGANLGVDVYPSFDETDIQDQAIDFTILNRKRKELLEVYPEIYNYIGSYRALINAVHYFGFDNLELYEYYRNIKKNSLLFGKLHKVLIQDIFDRSIPGWTSNDPSSLNYKKTNLFNLQYRITDFDGNYVNLYSLEEVQTKLTGMVKWLRRYIIPLSANIMDLTGLSEVGTTMYMNYNSSVYVKKIAVTQQVNAINFNYIQTLNTGTDYLMTINFYMITGCTMPDSWTGRIKTFRLNNSTNELEPVQYHELYKTDLLSYSFNVDVSVDPYMYIETESYNDYGLGFVNNKLLNYNEGRSFMLVNTNFNSLDYKYFTTDYGYYIIDEGRFYIIKY